MLEITRGYLIVVVSCCISSSQYWSLIISLMMVIRISTVCCLSKLFLNRKFEFADWWLHCLPHHRTIRYQFDVIFHPTSSRVAFLSCTAASSRFRRASSASTPFLKASTTGVTQRKRKLRMEKILQPVDDGFSMFIPWFPQFQNDTHGARFVHNIISYNGTWLTWLTSSQEAPIADGPFVAIPSRWSPFVAGLICRQSRTSWTKCCSTLDQRCWWWW